MSVPILSDQFYMKAAYREAEKAFAEEEVPVGVVIVCGQTIVAKAYNQVVRLSDPTAHAEMVAITSACAYLGSRYLQECTLFVTLEPCPMCAAALKWAQIKRLVIGASDEKHGYSAINDDLLHPKTVVATGIMQNECDQLLKDFFQQLR